MDLRSYPETIVLSMSHSRGHEIVLTQERIVVPSRVSPDLFEFAYISVLARLLGHSGKVPAIRDFGTFPIRCDENTDHDFNAGQYKRT